MQATNVLCNEDNWPDFFKGVPRFHVGAVWIPYKVNQENMKIVSRTQLIFAKVEDDTGRASGVGIVDMVPLLEKGLNSFFMYFGKPDTTLILTFLNSAWAQLAKVCPDNLVHLFCHLPLDVDIETIISETERAGFGEYMNNKTKLFSPTYISTFINVQSSKK